jgi:hypothetical protein
MVFNFTTAKNDFFEATNANKMQNMSNVILTQIRSHGMEIWRIWHFSISNYFTHLNNFQVIFGTNSNLNYNYALVLSQNL